MSTLSKSQSVRAGKTYATEKDWHRMQPTITKLYRDENRSLRQVSEIMESHYHFYATTKMYKSRLSTWKLDKKLKEAEVMVMLRQKEDRDAAGKRSQFFLRGQEVNWERVMQYEFRHHMLYTLADLTQKRNSPSDRTVFRSAPA
ncbi:uncharacterized protein CLUP02_09022 [Colletotrichum lupini]|uniref:Clr5 domain-containing protein n=1 Tax=Colletotrichum lupini TaxID=145971 RepID=A0A9Q8WH68_9PEZI|nr:uncharacterized protein CLUP02_09022 [Colletotrichum lupini]UQC83528.1 hypothetical protein CLUP02_09022 [Colletotrichum lupini]